VYRQSAYQGRGKVTLGGTGPGHIEEGRQVEGKCKWGHLVRNEETGKRTPVVFVGELVGEFVGEFVQRMRESVSMHLVYGNRGDGQAHPCHKFSFFFKSMPQSVYYIDKSQYVEC
jgi:hypothetical protein